MSTKYYTHFVLREGSASRTSEYRGVVEVKHASSRGGHVDAASMLAKNFECETKAIKILQWSRLH